MLNDDDDEHCEAGSHELMYSSISAKFTMLSMMMMVMVLAMNHKSVTPRSFHVNTIDTSNTSCHVLYRQHNQRKSTAVPVHTSPAEMSGKSDSEPEDPPYS